MTFTPFLDPDRPDAATVAIGLQASGHPAMRKIVDGLMIGDIIVDPGGSRNSPRQPRIVYTVVSLDQDRLIQDEVHELFNLGCFLYRQPGTP
jgi:hypothetical protein